jgi:hypothetical protein
MIEERAPASDTEFVQRRRLVVGLSMLLGGCAEPYVFPGTTGVPSPQRLATLDVEGRVEVLQGGQSVLGRDGMALFRGDEIRTFASSYAQCRFVDGNRVWLDYETRVRIGSVFTFFGRVFASVSGIFLTDSEFVRASSEGTEYTVAVGRGSPEFSVAVRTGAVLCQPRQGRWRPIRLLPGQRLIGRGLGPPRADRLDPREYEAEFGWVPARSSAPQLKFERQPQRREPPPPEQSSPPRSGTPPATTPPATTPPASTPPKSSAPARTLPRGGIIDHIERPSPAPSEPVIR